MTTERQVKDLMIRESRLSLKESNRGKRNEGLPLWSWMRGAKTEEASRIYAVCEGRGRYCYKTYKEAIEVASTRLCKKYKLTSVQHRFLSEYLSRRGRSRVDDSKLYCGSFDEKHVQFDFDPIAEKIMRLIKLQQEKQGLKFLPLRFILSIDLTLIILTEQLKVILK